MLNRHFIGFFARRIILMLPILFGIVTVTFFVTRVVPGDPAYLIAGPFAAPDVIKNIQEQLGTDQTLLAQYGNYVANAFHFDLGTSIFTGQAVTRDLRERLPATLELVILSLLVAVVIGVISGAYAARRRAKASDRAVRSVSFVLLSLPDFWLGLILLYFFFFRLGWAPAPVGQIGTDDPIPRFLSGATLLDALITANGPALWAAFTHAILPVVTLGSILSAPIARLMRSSMIEVLDADYIRFGRACGLHEKSIWRYGVRAALPPVVTFTGILFSVLIGGAVLVETVFLGGAAQYAAESIAQKDYPAIQGFVLASGVISVIVFLVVDILYVVIDPRVKLTGAGGR